MRSTRIVLWVLLLAPVAIARGQTPPAGDMDALFGPATRVNQGAGMSDEIRRALLPGPEHAWLARLEGQWRVEGVAGPQRDSVVERAEVSALMGGAWFELRLWRGDQLRRLAHLGYDGFRGSYAMWEVGEGFTSPQVRVGELIPDQGQLRFWRRYTIRRRGEEVPLREQVTITFITADELRWESFETIGADAERLQRDVRFHRVQPGRANLGAQQAVPVHREPRHHLVLDSTRFRVLDIRIPAGDTTQFHTHDTAVLYVYINPSPTVAQVLGGDWPAGPAGQPQNAVGDVRLDSSYVLQPVTHRVTNAGEGEFRLLAITSSGPTTSSATDRTAVLPGVGERRSTWFHQARVRIPMRSATEWFLSDRPVLIVQPGGSGIGVECEGKGRQSLNGPGGWFLVPAQLRCRVSNDGAVAATALAVQIR